MAWGIPSDINDYLGEVFDDFIVNWGKDCTLHYPPRYIPCDNCFSYPGMGGTTVSHYRHGGPIHFTAGSPCPLCQSSGKKASEVAESIRLIISEDAGKFSREPGKYGDEIPGNLRIPAGAILVKGYQRDWPKLLRADYVVIQISIEPIVRAKYRLVGTGADVHNILPGRYFICLLERV